ncbi:MAG: hypothetical protein WCJ49_07150, partial [Deltaproteobacteria bacterium]
MNIRNKKMRLTPRVVISIILFVGFALLIYASYNVAYNYFQNFSVREIILKRADKSINDKASDVAMYLNTVRKDANEIATSDTIVTLLSEINNKNTTKEIVAIKAVVARYLLTSFMESKNNTYPMIALFNNNGQLIVDVSSAFEVGRREIKTDIFNGKTARNIGFSVGIGNKVLFVQPCKNNSSIINGYIAVWVNNDEIGRIVAKGNGQNENSIFTLIAEDGFAVPCFGDTMPTDIFAISGIPLNEPYE